ncbi:hypothetical protein MKS88_000742 [Plasmodium brasilianum]|uniref:Uncharacterized protein n=2 Tax=Plasmodium (Plasmodium) TaxID=418103 RepID=A0A1D3JKV1_PLAMA|nr:conserved Plasmodium protein, unknown function [Plasmodium malariae]KAI4840975.1 hypothetical protein MKS88_000742 [Plasmodium brasilianum]SBT87176.1 conserved Plasmodium protein, unknown function [Plasmodium malariae]
MLKYISCLNKRLIYKLHVENDKIIDMPLFLVDNLYVRSKEELILLLSNAISFNKKDFLVNYRRVLLKDNEAYSSYNNSNETENGSNNVKDYSNGDSNKKHNTNCEIDKNTTCDSTNGHYKYKLVDSVGDIKWGKNFMLKDVDMHSTQVNNCYKYNNEEYNELINYLSEIYSSEESWNSNCTHLFEEDEEEDYMNYLQKKNDKERKDSKEKKTQEYSLTGYIPNDFFFRSFKNRIISIKGHLSYNDLFSLIYLYSKKRDIQIMKTLGEQYIYKMEREKDKQVNYKHIIHMLNIFIKLNYEKYNIHSIIKHLLQNMSENILINDLKLSALGFTCLSRLNLYNMLFYDYIYTFLKNVNDCSHLCCSMVLHCIGYHKHYMVKKRKKLYDQVKSFNKLMNRNIISEKCIMISNDIYKFSNNPINNDNLDDIVTEEAKKAQCGYKKTIPRDFKINILTFQLCNKNRDIINKLEHKLIDRLIKMDLHDISEKSISSIFHFYFLINKNILTDKDHIIFSKLSDILIKNKINFLKPRSFLMSSYTLILHKYFTNIHISSYFLIQCAKLIKWLKGRIYIDNLLFVLMGFAQNQVIFYKNKKNSTYPKVYVDKKNNKLCNFKVENKYIDMLEKCEYEVNILEKRDVKPVSCRAAILYIFNEITNLDYELNKNQIILYLQLFSSLDIKLSADIKQKLFILIINYVNDLICYINLIFQLAIKMYGISSKYMKTIALHYLEKLDHELCKLCKLLKKDEKYFSNFLAEYNIDTLKRNTYSDDMHTHLYDLDSLSYTLFIFDQIDVTKKDFIINLSKLMSINEYFILIYKKNNFNSYIYLLHYIGSLPIDTQEHKKLIDFLFTNLEEYIELSYKEYMQNRGKAIIEENDMLIGLSKRQANIYDEYKSNETREVNNKGTHDCTTEDKNITDCFYNEVNHKIIKDKIFLKDLILLLDSIRINKAYGYNSLLRNITAMINTEKIKMLSDEDVELVNYIFIDMGLMNKHVMDEAMNRGLTIGLKV